MATPSLLSRVIVSQWQDAEIVTIRDRVQSGTGDEGWTVHADGSLRYRGQVVVPQLTDLREEILREFHCSPFSVHPGGTLFDDVSHVSRLRLSTRSQQGYFSHWRWLSGSGSTSQWTL